MITAEHLREILHYSPETGVFTWVKSESTKIKPGDKAGSLHTGYVRLNLNGWRVFAHTLAWLYVHGTMPCKRLDHINGNRTDNRIDNLRELSASGNSENQRRAKKHSKSGYLGVSIRQRRYSARIRVDGVLKHIGTFDSPEEAHAAYVEAKRLYHPYGTL